MEFKLLTYPEHHFTTLNEIECSSFTESAYNYNFKKRRGGQACFSLLRKDTTYQISLSYFIGVDWIDENKTAICVEPKLNSKKSPIAGNLDITSWSETNYLKMFFNVLQFQEIEINIDELFEIKWEKSEIEIPQKQDLLTPFLLVQFLNLLKIIVRKGLKKSYYKTEQNLYSKIKGKVLAGKTIKQNIFRNKSLYTYCRYEEFDLDHLENRLLKKALVFTKRYLSGYSHILLHDLVADLFNYITPAFETISDAVQLNEIKFSKTNVFYGEYEEALRLAKLILNRFGYNLSNTQTATIRTPPFWIDMSKLFELYVLALLKERFGKKGEVKYQYSRYWNYIDYLLNTSNYKMVVDAKYKKKYNISFENEDIRQVSGYARLESVYVELGKPLNEIIDCLIIYPDQVDGLNDLLTVDFKDEKNKIKEYVQVYKVGIKLPIIET